MKTLGLLSSLGRQAANEIRDWYVSRGFPESVAERIASGELDPSYEARMQRASDRFDIENPEYTGSMDLLGDVNTPIWTTQNPPLAATYANPRKGGNITPVFLDREGVSTVRADGTRWNNINDSGRSTNDYMRKAQDYGLPSVAFKDIRDVGPYTSKYPRGLLEQAFQPSNTTVTLDPTKIRSVNAMFDPEYTGPNILGTTAATAGALGLLASPEEAEAGFINRGGRTLLEAFHGSPHRFNRFDMSKIGTGEGAQAYGYGLYFADDENLARAYRDTLKMKNDPREGINKIVNDVGLVAQGSQRVRNKNTGAIMTADPNNQLHQKILRGEVGSGDYEILPASEGLMDSVVAAMRDDPRLAEFADNKDIVDDVVTVIRGQEEGGTVSDSALSAYRRINQNLPEPTGALYRTEIDVTPDQLLDWDKPLTEQPKAIQELLGMVGKDQEIQNTQNKIDLLSKEINEIYQNAVEKMPEATDFDSLFSGPDYGLDGVVEKQIQLEQLNKELTALTAPRDFDIGGRKIPITVQDSYLGRDLILNPTANQKTTQALLDKGIKGIQYFDGASRSAGEGTRNYVIFDDNLIRIAERGSADPRLLAGMAGGGLLAASAPSLFEYSPERALQAANQGLLGDAMTVDEQADMAHRRLVNERMGALGMLQDPMYEYGDFSPTRTNLLTGETSLAFPKVVQGLVGALMDIGSTRDTKRYNPAALLDVL